MRYLMRVSVLVFAAGGLACSESGQRVSSPAAPTGLDGTAAKPNSDLSVTTIIENVDANGFTADLTNDGLGPYSNGVDAVRSVLAAAANNGLTHGDWQFSVPASSARKVGIALDLEDAVQPGEPAYLVPATPPFWGTRLLPADGKVKCTAMGNSMIAMTAGATFTCPLLNSFDVADRGYSRHAAASFTGWPETSNVQVTCNAANATGCTDWFIEPIARDRAIARLKQAASRRNETGTHIGSFYVRLRIHVTRP